MNYPSFLEHSKKKSTLSSSPVLPQYHYDKLPGNGYSNPGMSSPNGYRKSVTIDNRLNEQQNSGLKNYKSNFHTNSQEILPPHTTSNSYKYDGYRRDKNSFADIANRKYGNLKKSLMEGDKKDFNYSDAPEQVSSKPLETQKRRAPRASMPLIGPDHEEQFLDAPLQKPKTPQPPEKEGSFFKKKTSELSTQNLHNPNTELSSFKKDLKHKMHMRKSSVDLTEGWRKQISPLKKERKKKFSLKDFEKIKDLGSGKYGQVFLARQKETNLVCALKIIEKKQLKEEQITEQFIRQIKIQLFLNHPNIIKMFGFFDDQVNMYIILEVGMGGQLYKQLKRREPMPEHKVANIMRQVCQAVCQLHSHSIIHRDIKPQNIVMHENVVKLCDFGWSVHRDEKLRSTFCGTPLYVCPQILKGKDYDEKIDIWSLGVMMYEMLVGENPFKIAKQEDLIKIVKDRIAIPSYATVSAQAESFLFCCLQKNPSERKNIRQLMNHEFFKKYPDKSDKKMGL